MIVVLKPAAAQDDIDKFIEMGAEIQSNYASIIGYYGKGAQKTVKKLLKKVIQKLVENLLIKIMQQLFLLVIK